MSRLIWATAGIAAVITGCGPTLSEDFDSFCRVVNETNKQTNVPATDRLAMIMDRAPEFSKSEESKAAGSVWKQMADVPLDKRYAFLTDAAHTAGKADYRCSGFEKLLATATVEAAARQKAAEEKKALEAGGTPDAGVSPDAGTGSATAEKATKKTKKKRRKKRR